jgi:acyl carrier protein
MNEGPLLTALATILRVPAHQLTDDTEIAPADWDSIQILEVIAAIDESYGTTVPMKAIEECRTLGDLRARIRASAEAG